MRVVYMFWSISQLESKRHMSNYSSLSNSALVSVADPVNNVWWWWWSRLIFNISPNLWHLSELYISMNEQMLGQKEEVFFGWELFGEFGNQSVRAVTAAGCCHRKCQAGKSIDCFLTTKTQTVKTLQQAGNPAQLFYLNVACSLFWS